MQDDLANFPLPFFDPRDTARLELPVVFAGTPSLAQQRAAAVMSSYFGSLAGWWRQARFPVSFGALPEKGHAGVLAVNVDGTAGRPAAQAAAGAGPQRCRPAEGSGRDGGRQRAVPWTPGQH
ncbi:hypothetical protein G6F55_013815 [Rhizopus delemar]|nr:hypothetical protein G6F55_013815 [Rhizopus delemar]